MRRCLAKNPDERWQTAGDVVRELKQRPTRSLSARTQDAAETRRSKAAVRRGMARASLSRRSPDSSHGAIVAGFQRWSTTLAGQIRSVAVLPLENLSGDPEQEYFADGMTEQLIADLATIGGLRVISRTSVMHYRTAPKPVPTIARELQVDAIIEGSVVRAGDRCESPPN